MTSILLRERDRGRLAAKEVQDLSTDMTGTELNAVDNRIPRFAEAVKEKNMLDRPVGFVCKSSAGRVVKLLQPYDSTVYTHKPEEIPTQWGFVRSTDPEKVLPFVPISTRPYNTGEYCTENGQVFRPTVDSNVWAPSTYPAGWEKRSWELNRLQKMLEGANIKLSEMVSNSNGLSAWNILNFIMDGGVFSEDVFKEMWKI